MGARANRETDNPNAQATYLEAACEIDPEYVIRRVESRLFAVNDEVMYIYRRVSLYTALACTSFFMSCH